MSPHKRHLFQIIHLRTFSFEPNMGSKMIGMLTFASNVGQKSSKGRRDLIIKKEKGLTARSLFAQEVEGDEREEGAGQEIEGESRDV